MKDSAAIDGEFSHDVQNITSHQELSEENLVKDLENITLTSKNVLMELKNEASSLCKKILHMDSLESLTVKTSQFEQACKEKEKYSHDLLYVDGEIQYKKLKNAREKDKINELKDLIQKAIVELKEREHEKDAVCKKYIEKHEANKKAARYYKSNLDFYIHVEKIKENFHITVCYFTQKYDNTYSFTISKDENDSQWILNNVQPQLGEPQFKALQMRFCSTNNLSALLCTIRKIFLLKLKN